VIKFVSKLRQVDVFFLSDTGLVKVYGVERHFQQYFSYMVTVSFIGGGNGSIREKKNINAEKAFVDSVKS
jgi:hypothetical protein